MDNYANKNIKITRNATTITPKFIKKRNYSTINSALCNILTMKDPKTINHKAKHVFISPIPENK